jgi:hypothetical protein
VCVFGSGFLTLSVPGAVHITTRALGRRSRYGGRLVASHPRQCSTLGRWKLRSSCCSRSRQPALVFTLIKIVRRYAEVLDQQTCWCWSSDTPHSPTATLAVPRPRLCPPAHRRRRHLRHRHPRRAEPHRLNHLTASESAVATHSAASGTRHFRYRCRCCLPVTGARTWALAYFVGGRSPRNTIAKSFANC